MFVAIFLLPESPKYLYSKMRFDEAREAMSYIARFNGLEKVDYFIFDTEVESDAQLEKRKRLGAEE